MSDIASRHMENPEMPGNSPVDLTAQQQSKSTFFKKISTIGAGGKQYFDQVDEVKLSTIQHELEVGNDKEKLVAMKRLLAVCFSPFFSLIFHFTHNPPHNTTDDQQGSRRCRSVPECRQVCDQQERRGAQARVHVPGALCRGAAAGGPARHQLAAEGHDREQPAHACQRSPLHVQHPRQGNRSAVCCPLLFSSKKHKPLFSHSPFLPF